MEEIRGERCKIPKHISSILPCVDMNINPKMYRFVHNDALNQNISRKTLVCESTTIHSTVNEIASETDSKNGQGNTE